jgi:hypothetical protein
MELTLIGHRFPMLEQQDRQQQQQIARAISMCT